jgi:hypothetical protein
MEVGKAIFETIFSVNSIWSVVARGVLWFVIATVIIISTDSPHPQQSLKKMKSNLGFLMMFLVLSTSLMYLLFGFSPTG